MADDEKQRSVRRRPRGRGASTDPPVVRVDIYTRAGSGQVEARAEAVPVQPAVDPELDRRCAELDEREAELAGRAEKLAARARDLDARAAKLEQARTDTADSADLDRRRRRLAAQEEALSERTHELHRLEEEIEEREHALAEREAKVLVDLEFKEDAIECREQALAEQEQRLTRKEQELKAYVGQLQERLTLGAIRLA
jgi:uncharacterized protein (DUF3084 family)